MDCDLIKELRQNGVEEVFIEFLQEILGVECEEDGDLEIEGDFVDLEQENQEEPEEPSPDLEKEPDPNPDLKEKEPDSSPDLKAQPSPDLKAQPSLALKAQPSLALKAQPSPDLKAQPSLALKAQPSLALKAQPGPDLNLKYYLDRIEKFQAKFSIKPGDEHFGFNSISKNDLKFLKDFYYFQIPNVIKQLKHLIDVYKILKENLGYESKNSTSFIKILNNNDGTGTNIEDVDKEISGLYKQILRLIFGYGKQLMPRQYPLYFFKSFKFRKEILKSKDFYKYFFSKNPAILNIPSFSLDHPKMQTIKFYLNQLYGDLLNDSSKKKIKLLLLLLKDVKSYNHRNISLQGTYRKIFDLILKIFENKIHLLKILIDKSSDLYELYLFYKMAERFGGLEELRQKIENIDKLDDLKEDKSLVADFNGTINLDNEKFGLDTSYDIKLSFGGNIGKTKEGEETYPQFLEDNIGDFIRKNSNELFAEIIKTSGRQGGNGLTPDFIIRIWDNENDSNDHSKAIGSIILDSKFSKYSAFFGNCNGFDVIDLPLLKYYEELRKYFSYEGWDKRGTLKIIILYPGDKKIERKIESINALYQRATNVIACPISLYNDNVINNQLDYLEKQIKFFLEEIDLYKKKKDII